jgi:hypothetical protein
MREFLLDDMALPLYLFKSPPRLFIQRRDRRRFNDKTLAETIQKITGHQGEII